MLHFQTYLNFQGNNVTHVHHIKDARRRILVMVNLFIKADTNFFL